MHARESWHFDLAKILPAHGIEIIDEIELYAQWRRVMSDHL